jgi:hypothetical protein
VAARFLILIGAMLMFVLWLASMAAMVFVLWCDY